MFTTGSRPTITKSVVESADSGLESTNSTTDSAADPVKISLWVRAFGEQGIRNQLIGWRAKFDTYLRGNMSSHFTHFGPKTNPSLLYSHIRVGGRQSCPPCDMLSCHSNVESLIKVLVKCNLNLFSTTF